MPQPFIQKNHTISECLDNLQEHKKSLIANFRYTSSQIDYHKYLWVIKSHKSGYPHLHMMIFTKKDFMPYEEKLQNLCSKKYGAASKEHNLKLGSHNSKGESKKLDHLTQYVFKYMGKSIVSENTFDENKSNNIIKNPANLIFHSQVFKKFKPVKGKKGVKKMKDGTHRTFLLGRGSYRLWDSSRGLKEIMQMDIKEEGEPYPREALKRVKQLKPFLSETEIAVGISKSKQYLFTPSKTDIEELRRETTPWQTASMKSMKE